MNRSIRFPRGRSLGTLYRLSGDFREPWDEIAPAQGTVVVEPRDAHVILRVRSDRAARDLAPLAALKPHDLQEIDFAFRTVPPSQLEYL